MIRRAPRSRPRQGEIPVFAAADLTEDWRMLCEEIGERRAGTAAEQAAADFIAARLRAGGAADVRTEVFPCVSLRRARAEVHERSGRHWHAVEAVPLVGAPGTPGGRAVSGEVAWLELPENATRLRPRGLRGRIAAVFGPLPTSALVHRRLLAAEPLAIVHIDDRLPFPWAKNDGVYPYWARTHGMLPTLTVPYTAGWHWRRDGIRELKVRVTVDAAEARSQNVIAEWPGRSPELPAIVLTAHHDTQCNNVGADDNASGVVCLLALARALAGATRRRTVRLISFGTEEQLSVGSTAYVRQHATTARQVGLVINFDSVSSPLGHWMMSVAGDGALARVATRRLAAHGLDVDARQEIIPFSDQFPFNRVGVPSLWFMRTNFPGGRWQHHSRHDSLENVSVDEVIRLLGAVYPLLNSLAAQAKWPFLSRLSALELAQAQRLGRELFG